MSAAVPDLYEALRTAGVAEEAAMKAVTAVVRRDISQFATKSRYESRTIRPGYADHQVEFWDAARGHSPLRGHRKAQVSLILAA
jgi:hypothetical protein